MCQAYDLKSFSLLQPDLKRSTDSTVSFAVSQTSDYYASLPSLSVNSCVSSQPESPLLCLSDAETNSLDGVSMVNTSGLAMAEDSAFLSFQELPCHPYHTRQQMQRLREQISCQAQANHFDSAAVSSKLSGGGSLSTDRGDFDVETLTAFVPVRKSCYGSSGSHRLCSAGGDPMPFEDSSTANNVSGSVHSQELESLCCKRGGSSATGTEKRKCFPNSCSSDSGSSGNSNLSVAQAKSRVLTASRRTAPIKLLIPLTRQCHQHVSSSATAGVNEGRTGAASKAAAPIEEDDDLSSHSISSLRKRNRFENYDRQAMANRGIRRCHPRPSLDFDKMREKMVKDSKKKTSANAIMTSNRARVKLRSWSDGYQLRSCGDNFLFRPLEPPIDMSTQVEHEINDLVKNNCRL
ncbi:unnamed protein product [Soboliphyme baturini]|uniref:Uncharacterized protein n=1 Tax=Soboliphyme baturini TaxID=241478 RepID=A0A183IBL6_9BILA|nr:unnamed protein product [Soboliphyme baturini]